MSKGVNHTSTMKQTYTMKVICNNCDQISEAQLPKGKPLNEPVECPNCGCKSATKYREPLPIPKIRPWTETTWLTAPSPPQIDIPMNEPDNRPFPRIVCECNHELVALGDY